MEPQEATLLGSPIGDVSAISSTLSEMTNALKTMGDRLTHLFTNDAILLLKHSFVFPKLPTPALYHTSLAVTLTHWTHTCSVSHYHWWMQQWTAEMSGESKYLVVLLYTSSWAPVGWTVQPGLLPMLQRLTTFFNHLSVYIYIRVSFPSRSSIWTSAGLPGRPGSPGKTVHNTYHTLTNYMTIKS